MKDDGLLYCAPGGSGSGQRRGTMDNLDMIPRLIHYKDKLNVVLFEAEAQGTPGHEKETLLDKKQMDGDWKLVGVT